MVAVLYHLLNFITTAGMDYEPLTVNIQYNPAMAQEEIIVCEGINIIDDAIPEGMETFSVSLDTDDPAVRFIIETAPIAITDNDGKCNHILLCSAMTMQSEPFCESFLVNLLPSRLSEMEKT